MCTTNGPENNQQSGVGNTKSDLLQELIQIRERLTVAGCSEAAHFLDVAAAALEEVIERNRPSNSPQKGLFDSE